MAKFIGINQIENMFDIELRSFRHVSTKESGSALCNKEVIWIRHVNDLTQALTLHSLGLTNKEIQASLYFTPPLIPQ